MENKPHFGRILRSKEYQRIKLSGFRVFASRGVMLSCLPEASEQFRLGWTLPSYIGSAVVRNRLKRWFREYLWLRLPQLKGFEHTKLDVNIVLRRGSKEVFKNLTRAEIWDSLDQALSQAQRKMNRASR